MEPRTRQCAEFSARYNVRVARLGHDRLDTALGRGDEGCGIARELCSSARRVLALPRHLGGALGFGPTGLFQESFRLSDGRRDVDGQCGLVPLWPT
jgi:hypothetical protein